MRPLTRRERKGHLPEGSILLVDQGNREEEPYKEIVVVVKSEKRKILHPTLHMKVISTDNDPLRVGQHYYHQCSVGGLGKRDIPEDAWGYFRLGKQIQLLERSDLPLYMDWNKGVDFERILQCKSIC
jgi:hypothetical protein